MAEILDPNGTKTDRHIPPCVTQGQHVAGNQHRQKNAVPVGGGGPFLQADSTTETGLRWVKLKWPGNAGLPPTPLTDALNLGE